MKKIITSALLAVSMATILSPAQAQVHPMLDKALKCADIAGISPAVGAYALLESSKIVVRESRGPLTLYLGAFEQQGPGTVTIFGMIPNRLLVVSRKGQSLAVAGALYPAVQQLSDEQIVGSYKSGLKRSIDLDPVRGAALDSVEAVSAGISREPVSNNIHLLLARLASGERLALCAPKQILLNYIR